MDSINRVLYRMNDSETEYSALNIQAIAERWDKKADDWDEQLLSEDCHLNQDQSYDNFIIEANSLIENYIENYPKKSYHLLDVGCGTGLISERLQRENLIITGIDISEKMLMQANKKNIYNAQFLLKNIFNRSTLNDLPKANFIFSRGILLSHYTESQARILLKNLLLCCLKNQSVIMLDYLNKGACSERYHLPQNKTYYSLEMIKNLISNLGIQKYKIVGDQGNRVQFLVLYV